MILFIAAQFAFVGGHDFNLPTVALGVAAARYVANRLRNSAASSPSVPAAHFDEDVFVVVGIFGQQQFLQFGIEFADFGFYASISSAAKSFISGSDSISSASASQALGKPIVLEYFDDGVSSACSRVSLR